VLPVGFQCDVEDGEIFVGGEILVINSGLECCCKNKMKSSYSSRRIAKDA